MRTGDVTSHGAAVFSVLIMTMRVTKHIRLAATQRPASDGIELAAHERHLRRKLLVTENGIEVMVDFPLAVFIEDGDHLELENGATVEVRAAEEQLIEVRAMSAAHLVKLAWHIGNRHLAAQIEGDRILILQDRVIGAMLEQLGANVTFVQEQFFPEHGAYHGH